MNPSSFEWSESSLQFYELASGWDIRQFYRPEAKDQLHKGVKFYLAEQL